MQIFVIILMGMVYLADQPGSWRAWRPDLPAGAVVIITLVSYLVLVLAALALITVCRRRLDRTGSWKAAALADRGSNLVAWLLLLAHGACLIGLGWLDAVRELTADLILVDEILVITPPLLALASLWVMQYPIHRRVREATLMRRLDEGQPIYPIWTRGQYLLNQVRLHLVLMLLPILLIMGWGEMIEGLWPEGGVGWIASETAELLALVVGAGTVFLLAPVMIRILWDTKPLPAGPLRDRLEHLVRKQQTTIRRILVWNTYGMMINGAVLGLIGRLRYVLLSDALLDGLNDDQIEAVMAHEVGHIRRHHMPWLAIAIIAMFAVSSFVVYYAAEAFGLLEFPSPPQAIDAPTTRRDSDVARGWREWSQAVSMTLQPEPSEPAMTDWVEPGIVVSTFVIAITGFGWVSRRFERQADAFAVQHLSGMTRRDGRESLVSGRAVEIMVSSLGVVADLNHVPRRARSWRHGSIAHRQNYLRSLVGKRCDQISIDRQVRWIKRGSVLVLAGLALFSIFFE